MRLDGIGVSCSRLKQWLRPLTPTVQRITDNDIVLVDFWAEWCGPCKRFGPIYEKASEEYDGIVFAKLDTDAHPELTGLLGMRAFRR